MSSGKVSTNLEDKSIVNNQKGDRKMVTAKEVMDMMESTTLEEKKSVIGVTFVEPFLQELESNPFNLEYVFSLVGTNDLKGTFTVEVLDQFDECFGIIRYDTDIVTREGSIEIQVTPKVISKFVSTKLESIMKSLGEDGYEVSTTEIVGDQERRIPLDKLEKIGRREAQALLKLVKPLLR